MTDDQLRDDMANESLGYTTYTPRDIEIMHHTYAMDSIRSLKAYVDELLYRENYHNDPITREKVMKISTKLKDIENYFR